MTDTTHEATILITGEEKTADTTCTLYLSAPGVDAPDQFTIDPDWRDVAWFDRTELNRLYQWLGRSLGYVPLTLAPLGTEAAQPVVHVNDDIPFAAYIGRSAFRLGVSASPLANPFAIGKHGGRRDVVRLYAQWIADQLTNKRNHDIVAELMAVRDRPLACWCRHAGTPRTAQTVCHGDVIAGLLESYTDAELIAMTEGD